MNRSPVVIVLLLAAGATLVSCSEPKSTSLSISDDAVKSYSSTRAILDPSTGSITLPLDKYAMSWSDLNLVASANDKLIDSCLRTSSFTNPLLSLNRSTRVVPEDRRYGPWSPALATRWGYGSPADDVASRGDTLLASQSQMWQSAQEQCYRSTKLLPSLSYSDSKASGAKSLIAVGAQGAGEAAVYAASQPAWTSARSKWWDCLRKNGIEPRTGANEWVPNGAGDGESAVRTAITDVMCKSQTGLVATLSNLEARYQRAYEAKNEAALSAQRAKVDSELQKAKQILGV